MPANCRSSTRRLADSVEAARLVTRPEREDRAEPELKAPGHRILADLNRIGDIPRQMRQTGLVSSPMTLLSGVAVGKPHGWAVAVHHRANHRGSSGQSGLMHDRLGRAEDPVVGVRALNPDASLIRGDHLSLTKRRDGADLPLSKAPLRPAKQVHQPALAEREPEQIR